MPRTRSVGLLSAVGLLMLTSTLDGQTGGQTPTPAVLRPAPRYVITGVVIDSSRAPLPDADVGLNVAGEVVAVARTGADGRFRFEDILPVRAALRVRRVGFHARTLALDVASDTARRDLAIQLSAASQADGAVTSDSVGSLVAEEPENEDPSGRLRAFNERRGRHRFAYFFDRDQIRRQNLQYASETLRAVPGAVIRASSRIGNTVRLRGCRPMLWVDGMRVPGAELDEMARPSDVAAIEVYPTLGAMPPQFADMPSQCGSIVVWMR